MTKPNENAMSDVLDRAIVSLRDEQVSDCPPAYVVASTIEKLQSMEEETRAKPARPILRWMGALTMRQRIAALGGVGIATILGFLLLWGGIATRPLSAMEKMAEAVRRAKSYRCTEIVKTTDDFPKPGRPAVFEATFTVYRQLPGALRTEATYSYHPWNLKHPWKGPGPEKTEVRLAGKPGIYIHHPTKTFRRYPPARTGPYSSPFDRIEDLGKFSGKADLQLGTREINGMQANGFQIDIKKMCPNARGSVAEIWLDPEFKPAGLRPL